MPPLPAIQEFSSMRISLSKIIREMRIKEAPYQDALREFKRQYVVWALMRNGCHLGRTAKELGMHHNTLTRTIHELRIDAKEIRKEMRGRSTVNTTSNHHSVGFLHPGPGSLVSGIGFLASLTGRLPKEMAE
jgi:Fis family transcriptional regulator